MSRIILLNKPFNVLSQFTTDDNRETLADYVTEPGFYAAGRLDYDSEGLMILTDDGALQHRLADPRFKLEKTYWVQVEGEITDDALNRLRRGIQLNDGPTRPAKAARLEPPSTLWQRNPPIRHRADQPTSWIEMKISEGRNRQVRRMTAATGFPTLRLIRAAIGQWQLDGLKPGEWKADRINLPVTNPRPKSDRPARRPSRKPQR